MKYKQITDKIIVEVTLRDAVSQKAFEHAIPGDLKHISDWVVKEINELVIGPGDSARCLSYDRQIEDKEVTDEETVREIVRC